MTPAIVVLTDTLTAPDRALAYATELAAPLQAHVVRVHANHDEFLSSAAAHSWASSRRQAAPALPTQVQVAETFLTGAAAELIRQQEPELMIMARPDPTDELEEAVSAAALNLLRVAPYPLLLVPTAGWGNVLPRRLALAVDGRDFHVDHHHGIVRQLLERLPARLTVVHVTDETNPDAVIGHRAQFSVCHSGLVHVPEGSPRKIVHQADVAEGILQGAAELDADLLVLIVRHHRRLGSLFASNSVTTRVINESLIPVLLLPSLD
ncbi:universal stress protein [Hymenobacter humi]|uniref:Universal stress protein n=1 Tax=Hymenobacter humi TaxID=1411620 RepID=A0ABW2U5E7_9BACT